MQFSDSKLKHLSRISKSKQNRENYVESHIRHGLSHQIRLTRESRGLTQSELANLVGVSQNLISRWESAGYGQYTVSTLNRIAAALDVALMVRFVPFSRMVDWLSSTPSIDLGLNFDGLEVASFNEEEQRGVLSTNQQQLTITSGIMPREMMTHFNKQPIGFRSSIGLSPKNLLEDVIDTTNAQQIYQSGIESNFMPQQILNTSQELQHVPGNIEENRR